MKPTLFSFFFALLSLALLSSVSARATTHVLMATYDMNTERFYYSPSAPFMVNVGDTVDWQMDFTVHTLVLMLGNDTLINHQDAMGNPIGGSDEKFVVTATGKYYFHCTQHPATMQDTFTAVASGVAIPAQPTMSMDPIYPNPAAEQAMVHFTLDVPQHVTLRIYNAAGTLIESPTDEDMTSGFHMIMIDTKQLASGSYQYVLQAGNAVLRRSAIVIK